MTINNYNDKLILRKDSMYDIYCPHCSSQQSLCASKLSSDTTSLNPELGVTGAISGFMECLICNEEIGFDIYPPHTKNTLGISIEVYKKR